MDTEKDVKAENKKTQKASTKTPRISLFRSKFWISFIVISLVIIVGSLVVNWSIGNDEPKEVITLDTSYQDTERTYTEKARELDFLDDYDGAQQVLQDGADKTTGNAAAKADFYVLKAELAINNERYEESLAFAVLADEGNPTVSSAVIAAESSVLLGDNEAAIKYYQLAADRTPEDQKDPNSFGGEYGYYLSRIEQLGGDNEK